MVLDVQGIRTERLPVVSEDIKQQTTLLVGHVQVSTVGRKRQARGFVRVHVAFHNGKVLAIPVAPVNTCFAAFAVSVFRKVKYAVRIGIVIGWNKALDLIRLAVKQRRRRGGIVVRALIQIQHKHCLVTLGHDKQLIVFDINAFRVGEVRF